MAIAKKWSHYTKVNVKKVPNQTGSYEIGNRTTNTILYVGEGLVKTRLLAHFPGASEPVVGADGFRYVLTETKKQCVTVQNKAFSKFLKKNKTLPKYNTKRKN